MNEEATSIRTVDLIREIVLDALQCPVCLDYPREGAVFTCRANGHLIYKACRWKVRGNRCPTCRQMGMDANPYANRLATQVLAEITVPCKNSAEGCKWKEKVVTIPMHEATCMYREVHCPARHRGSCPWEGSVAKLITHVRQDKCLQLLKQDEPKKPFSSWIGDFSSTHGTVFKQLKVTFWKPIMLINRQMMHYLLYLSIYRIPQGQWHMVIRSFAPIELLERMGLRARILVFSKGRQNGLKFCYEGDVLPHTSSNQEAANSGQYLAMTDSQVRRLKEDTNLPQSEGIDNTQGANSLFGYEISFTNWACRNPMWEQAGPKQAGKANGGDQGTPGGGVGNQSG